MPVTLRYAELVEYPQIARFLDEHWARDHIYVRDRELFQWTFARHTHWTHTTCSFAVAEDSGALVGILGGIPFTFNFYGNPSLGVWIANYVVRPDYRKGSLALQLLSMFRRPSLQPLIAFGINPATGTIYKVLRGEVLPYIPRYFRLFPQCVDRMENLLRIAHPEWSASDVKTFAHSFPPYALPEPSVSYMTLLPDNWDTQEWTKRAQTTIGAARNTQFLKWRYIDHPRFQYRFIIIPERDRIGLLIWRLEMIRRRQEGVLHDVDYIARILEFLPVSNSNANELLANCLNDAAAAGAFAADFYAFSGTAHDQLLRSGFVATCSLKDANSLPSRFQPLDGKPGGILSAYFLPSGVPPCSVSEHCPWYWTKGDSDQDRPN